MWSFYFSQKTLQKAQWEAEGERQQQKEKKHTHTLATLNRTLWRQGGLPQNCTRCFQPFICAFFQPKVVAGGPDSSTKAEDPKDGPENDTTSSESC